MDMIERQNRYKSKAGFYFPAMFFIELSKKMKNIRDILNPNIIRALDDDNDELILYHEYLHFLQDICCGFGSSNLCKFLNSVRHFYGEVSKKKAAGDFHVSLPFEITDQTLLENAQLFDMYDDGGKYYSLPSGTKIKKIERINEQILIRSNAPEMYSSRYKVSLSSGDSVWFGAQAIMEGMAYILEKSASKRKRQDFLIPYDLPNAVFEHILPTHSQNTAMLLDLCEFALDTQHPAQTFIESLWRIQENINDFQINDNMYSQMQKHWGFNNFEGNKDEKTKNENNGMTAMEWCSKVNKMAIESVNGTYISNLYDKHREWLLGVLEEGMNLRKGKPIFSKIYDGTFCGAKNPREFLSYMIATKKLLPPVYNRRDGSFEIRDDNTEVDNHFTRAIFAVCSVVFWEKKRCLCLRTCIGTNKENGTIVYPTNKSCCKSPWDAIKEGRHCPFGVVGRTFNLGEMTIEKA